MSGDERGPRRAGALALALTLGACGADAAEPPCPAGHHRDASRAAAIVQRLGTVPEGATLVSLLAGTQGICFGDEALNVVTSDRAFLLASSLEDGEAAARLGHLLIHVRDGLPMGDAIPSDADCDALVREALDREAVAYVAEVRLQRALGVTPRTLAFEFAFELERLDEPSARARVRAYLEEHPTGAPNIDGLSAGYLARCLRER